MGKKRQGGWRSRQRKKKNRDNNSSGSSNKGNVWLNIEYRNELFEKYYKGQKIVPEGKWEDFMGALAKPLPMTFRISKYDGLYKHVQGKLEATEFFGGVDFKSLECEEHFKPLARPSKVPWYKDGLAWYFKIGRKHIRKFPVLKPFREWLVCVTNIGTVCRQEAASMLPPLFLDVKPHHYVLDMCAAPGSKTCQLLESLHAEGTSTLPKGIVVANDADVRRAHLLTKQIKRLRSPNFLVTNHQAQFFPNLFSPPAGGEATPSGARDDDSVLLFDRVLADVPCTGDGTVRKNPGIWTRWNPKDGAGLHTLQFQIAFRGAQLLKPGGLMVYSTCSLNPVENEAVVFRLLRTCKGGLELVDTKGTVGGLRTSPGLLTWRVMDSSGEWLKTFQQGQEKSGKILKEFFPPEDIQESKDLHLERCMRLLPHFHDSGGFFVAVFQRTEKPLPRPQDVNCCVDTAGGKGSKKSREKTMGNKTGQGGQTQEEGGNDTTERKEAGETANIDAEKGKPKEKLSSSGEKPFEPVETERLRKLFEQYGMEGKFDPSWLCQRANNSKKLHFVAPSVSQIIQYAKNSRLKVVHCGLRAFERSGAYPQDTKSRDRLCQDGALSLVPHLGRQLIRVGVKLLLRLFEETRLGIESIEDSDGDRKRVQDAEIGGCAILLIDDNHKVSMEPVVVAGWKSNTTIALMCTPPERQGLRYAISQAYPSLVSTETKSTPQTHKSKDSSHK